MTGEGRAGRKVARRVTLLIVVNLLVMLTLVAIASLFFHGRAMQFGYGNLLGWCLIIGMGGAFISLRFRAGWPR